jgi:hypothetical protein
VTVETANIPGPSAATVEYVESLVLPPVPTPAPVEVTPETPAPVETPAA